MGRPPYCNCLCSGVTTTTTTVIPPTTTTTVSPPSTTTTTLEPPLGRCCFLDDVLQIGCIDGVTQQYCQNLWGVTYLNWYKDAYCPCDSTTTTTIPPVTTTTSEPTTTTTTKAPFYLCCGIDCDTSPPTFISVVVENCEDCPPGTDSCSPYYGQNCGLIFCPPTTTPSPTTEPPPTTTVEPIPGTTTLAPTTTVSPTTTTAAPTTTTAAPTTTTAAPGTTTTPAPTTTIAPGTTQNPAAGPYGWSCQPAGGCLYVLNGEFATAEECAGGCF